MGYGVYWANGRWQGYEIPAFCDYPGCKEEIDRGMGWQHQEDEEEPPSVFCCLDHTLEPIELFEVEEKEHPEWLKHILTDESWKEWRNKEPEIVKKYKAMLKEKIK